VSPTSRTTPTGSAPVPPGDRLSTLPEGAPELTLGHVAAKWTHDWLVQPNGPRAGMPFQLTFDQFRFLLWWYAVDADGAWLFTHGVRQLAKGSGKSPFAAVLCLLELLAPVRLDRFDDRMPGGCRGKPVHMPWVQIAATAESQTVNTMRMVRAFASKRSKVAEEYNLDVGKTIYYKPPDGMLHIITSSADAADGAEATFVVGDQTERWRPANGGIDLKAVLADNLAKSGNRMLETPNAWEPGRETVAEATFGDWVAQEEGRIRDDEGAILYDSRKAPPDTDMSDRKSLVAGLEHVYGDCDWKRDANGNLDLRPIIRRIWTPSAKVDESKRKYLNWPTAPADAWTTPEAWALLADVTVLGEPRRVDPNEEIGLFFDGSKSRAATARRGVCMSDGHVFTIDVWEPDPAHNDEDVVDAADVDRVVRMCAEGRFGKVVGFLGDVREWESFVKIEWPPLFPDLRVMAVPGGKDPQWIAWDMRSHTFDFTQAAELALAEINGQMFTHDNDPRVARHVANMRNNPNRYGTSVGKESPDSRLKIDAGVCVIGARMVRRLVLAAKSVEKKKKSGIVY
jgi:hypothetical protein